MFVTFYLSFWPSVLLFVGSQVYISLFVAPVIYLHETQQEDVNRLVVICIDMLLYFIFFHMIIRIS